MSKTIDLLNEIQKNGRMRDVSIACYIINEVGSSSFLSRSACVLEDTKIVQVRVCAVRVGRGEYMADAIIYASVSKSLGIGEFAILRGSIDAISKESYSKELSLFKFRKENGTWYVCAVQDKPFDSAVFSDKAVLTNLGIFKSYPFTLVNGGSKVKPVTRMFETEVIYDLDYSVSKNKFEFDSVPLVDKTLLSDLQTRVLSGMLISPVLQVQVENENLVSAEQVASLIRKSAESAGRQVKIYDLRNKKASPVDVVKKLVDNGLVALDKPQSILLVPKVSKGISSIILGTECLI